MPIPLYNTKARIIKIWKKILTFAEVIKWESDKNPTTEGTNLVFVKFNFEWEDGVTGAKHERELIIPLQIVCKGWGYRLLWGIPIILALLVFGFINWNSIKSKTLNLFASLFPNSSNKSSTDDDF